MHLKLIYASYPSKKHQVPLLKVVQTAVNIIKFKSKILPNYICKMYELQHRTSNKCCEIVWVKMSKYK